MVFKDNREWLGISQLLSKIYKPILIIHGAKYEVASLYQARQISIVSRQASLLCFIDTGRTFGMKHPQKGVALFPVMEEVVQKTIAFITETSIIKYPKCDGSYLYVGC